MGHGGLQLELQSLRGRDVWQGSPLHGVGELHHLEEEFTKSDID